MNDLVFMKKNKIVKITPLLKGWSNDTKFILTAQDKQKYLLRISDSTLKDKKFEQYELLTKLNQMDINASLPIEIGLLKDNKVYMIFNYLKGSDASKAVKKLSDLEAYSLGFKMGGRLKKIHSIKVPKQEKSWYQRYMVKMPLKLANLDKCKYRISMQEELVYYYQSHVDLMINRPLVVNHSDYHLGNMVYYNNDLGIIDFDKIGLADPYDEFKP